MTARRRILMFAAELRGELVPIYIGHSAAGIRATVAEYVADGDWLKAKRMGWRVVRVVVEKAR